MKPEDTFLSRRDISCYVMFALIDRSHPEVKVDVVVGLLSDLTLPRGQHKYPTLPYTCSIHSTLGIVIFRSEMYCICVHFIQSAALTDRPAGGQKQQQRC